MVIYNYSLIFCPLHRIIMAMCWRTPQTWRAMSVQLHLSPTLPSSARLWRKCTLKLATGEYVLLHCAVALHMYADSELLTVWLFFPLRYYGCGLVVPESLEGCRILDLGSGSGRDCYMLSQLVGENGHVTGIDMTEDQVLHISLTESLLLHIVNWQWCFWTNDPELQMQLKGKNKCQFKMKCTSCGSVFSSSLKWPRNMWTITWKTLVIKRPMSILSWASLRLWLKRVWKRTHLISSCKMSCISFLIVLYLNSVLL